MKATINPRLAHMFQQERDSVREVTNSVEFTKAVDILLEAKDCYEGLYTARKKRRRNIRYAFGENLGQWSDLMEGLDNITEAQNISNQGKTPLQYNMILSSIQTVMGQFASNKTEPICVARDRDEQKLGEMMTVAMQAAYQSNQLWSLYTQNLLEVLISGIGFNKSRFGFNPATQTTDLIVENKNLTRMFFNQMEDVRNWDCYLIGELHDMRLADVLAAFSDGSVKRAVDIRKIFNGCTMERMSNQYGNLTSERKSLHDFLLPYDQHFCRVIEVWKLESKSQYNCHDTLTGENYWTGLDQKNNIENENRKRTANAAQFGIEPSLIKSTWGIHQYWYYRFMAPTGEILKEGETPYWHASHPYALKRFMGLDGTITSFTDMMIDAQRMLNRNITLADFILGSSSKGTLMIPDTVLGESTAAEMACEYRKIGSYIVYHPDPKLPNGGVPTEVSSKASNVGVSEMINLIRSLLPDLSGVHGALQGKQAQSGTSGKLYQAEADQAATNLVYTFETFKDLRVENDKKSMQLIQQYYDAPVYLGIVGKEFSEEAKMYDPSRVRNVNFDLSLSENTASINYRTMMNDYLMQLWQAQAISVKNMLSNSSLPFADKVLQSIESEEKEMKDVQAEMAKQGVPPQQFADPGSQQKAA